LIADGAERAAELADALGELIGKALENPTARSLGKLFQKHLTNRPAWIEEEKGVVGPICRPTSPDEPQLKAHQHLSQKQSERPGGPHLAGSDFASLTASHFRQRRLLERLCSCNF
jgi:hypothetical protein